MSVLLTYILEGQIEKIKNLYSENLEIFNQKIYGDLPIMHAIDKYIGNYSDSELDMAQQDKLTQIIHFMLSVIDKNTKIDGIPLYDYYIIPEFKNFSGYLPPQNILSRRSFTFYDSIGQSQRRAKLAGMLADYEFCSSLATFNQEMQAHDKYFREAYPEQQGYFQFIKMTESIAHISAQEAEENIPYKELRVETEQELSELRAKHSSDCYIFHRKAKMEQEGDYPQDVWLFSKAEWDTRRSEIVSSNRQALNQWEEVRASTSEWLSGTMRFSKDVYYGGFSIHGAIDLTEQDIGDHKILVKAVNDERLFNYLSRDNDMSPLKNSPTNRMPYDHVSLLAKGLGAICSRYPLLIFNAPPSAILATYRKDMQATQCRIEPCKSVWSFCHKTTHPLTDPQTIVKTTGSAGSKHNEIIMLSNEFLPKGEKIQLVGVGFIVDPNQDMSNIDLLCNDENKEITSEYKSLISKIVNQINEQNIPVYLLSKHQFDNPSVPPLIEALTLLEKLEILKRLETFFTLKKGTPGFSDDSLSEIQRMLGEVMQQLDNCKEKAAEAIKARNLETASTHRGLIFTNLAAAQDSGVPDESVARLSLTM